VLNDSIWRPGPVYRRNDKSIAYLAIIAGSPKEQALTQAKSDESYCKHYLRRRDTRLDDYKGRQQ
jgi:hypothetical protein